jgi:Ser-tRNA(Ala) deacylase AlaX
VGEIRFGKKKSYVVSKVVNSPIPSERARGVIWHIGYFASSSSSDSKQEQQEQQEILKESPSQYVDRTSRLLYARLHSAGHLIDVAMQQCGVGLIAGKGFHFPKGSYVEYVGKLNSDIKDTLKDRLQKVLNDLIEKDVPTTIHHVPPSKVPSLCFDGHCGDMSHLPQDKDVRVVCVGGDKGCPCGGTHVKSTKEIEKIIVKKIKNKKGNLRVSYECQ